MMTSALSQERWLEGGERQRRDDSEQRGVQELHHIVWFIWWALWCSQSLLADISIIPYSTMHDAHRDLHEADAWKLTVRKLFCRQMLFIISVESKKGLNTVASSKTEPSQCSVCPGDLGFVTPIDNNNWSLLELNELRHVNYLLSKLR